LNARYIIIAGAVLLVTVGILLSLPEEEFGNRFELLPAVNAGFAGYIPIEIKYVPSVGEYDIEEDLGNVRNIDDFAFSDAELRRLAENGFFARKSYEHEIYEVYNGMRKRNIPIFVTTDSILHAYHILYDYVLRQAEHNELAGSLLDLTSSMVDAAKDQYASLEDPSVREAARLNVAYFCVAGKLLDASFDCPDYVKDEVEGEMGLITQHSGFSSSPIFGVQEDYSQYVPRGHYTRSEVLKSYFRAMMWYGRMTFTLKMEEEKAEIELGRRHTRQALLVVSAISGAEVSGGSAFDVWQDIYEPTAFFVGETDDLSLYDYLNLSRDVLGEEVTEEELASDGKVDGFIREALSLQRPKISSTGSTSNMQGFRFMGQRFIPDSYMLQELVYSKTSRMMPKGLDVMSVLGSERAWELLRDEWDESNYEEQMEKLREEFSEVTLGEWTQNLYWLWLYTLKPLLEEREGAYPGFMLTEAWIDKQLVTALGSWTELRHDTILYAKQSYTELRGTPGKPKLVKGYVEPNPELYGRLSSLARMTREGLKSRSMLSEEFEYRLELMEDLCVKLAQISAKELEEKPLDKGEYETIWNIGGTLEELITIPPEMSGMTTDADTKMPVVADVHTDPNSGLVLEEATGCPMMLFVIVDIEGQFYVTAGASFSYYEFLQPLNERLTDEEWQVMIESGNNPPMPQWTESVFTLG
jgi:hypothetical protein